MHLREWGEKMPSQIAWSYWREEAALIIERVIYCPGSPGCSGSLLSLPGFPISPSPERRPHSTRRLSWLKQEKGRGLSPLCLPVPPSQRIRSGVGLGKGRLGFARSVPPLAHWRGHGQRAAPLRDHSELCQPAPAAAARESPRENKALKRRSGTGSVRAETASPFATSL